MADSRPSSSLESIPRSAASPEDPFRSSADNMNALPKEPVTAHTRTSSKSGAKAAGTAVQKGVDHAVSPARLPPLNLPATSATESGPSSASSSLPPQPTAAAAPDARHTGGSTESKRLLDEVAALLRSHDEHQKQQRSILRDTDPLHQALGLDANDAKPPRPFSPIPPHLQELAKLGGRIPRESLDQKHTASPATAGFPAGSSEAPPRHSRSSSSAQQALLQRELSERDRRHAASPPGLINTAAMPVRSSPSPQQIQLQRELSERKQAASPTGPYTQAASIAPTYASYGPYAVQMRPPNSMHGNQGVGGYGIAHAGPAAAGAGAMSSSVGHGIPAGSVLSESVAHGATQPLLGRAGAGASMSGIVASLPPGPPTVSGSVYGPGRYPLSPSASGSLNATYRDASFLMARPGAVNTPGLGALGGPLAVDNLIWDEKEKDVDDYLHNPDPMDREDQGCATMSPRGAFNVLALAVVIGGCLTLFAGYPLISHFTREAYKTAGATNLGGTNGTGQVPDLKIFQLIDPDTPQDAYSFTSPVEGQVSYQLVFSDEFNEEGRTFWKGDDPFWEAVDIWYGATHDYQWYSPEAINTTNGALMITMEAMETHNLNFQSGMLQSWNKFCYQGGYIEFSAILPGGPTTKGYWPAAWMMGNLARPGYLGSTDGMWPYSYGSCDTGILQDQLYLNQTGPLDTLTNFSTFSSKDPRRLSLLPGMRLPSCTCSGEDHPGPNVNTARSAPELDVFEVTQQGQHSYASQTYQIAPFDSAQQWKNNTDIGGDAVIYGTEGENRINTYKGTPYQESVSGYAQVPDDGFMDTDRRFIKYGVEYFPDWDANGEGTITWFIDGKPTWTARGSTLDPAPSMDVGRRLFPVEPMTIIMNLGISSGFQPVNWNPLTGVNFPAVMLFDYVRLYQESDKQKLSCDPPDHPTLDYINSHPDIFANPNLTVYPREKYGWPKNKLTGC